MFFFSLTDKSLKYSNSKLFHILVKNACMCISGKTYNIAQMKPIENKYLVSQNYILCLIKSILCQKSKHIYNDICQIQQQIVLSPVIWQFV